MGEGESKPEGSGEMRKRRVTLEDGPYLIYYTFGDGAGEARVGGVGGPGREAGPGAWEERDV